MKPVNTSVSPEPVLLSQTWGCIEAITVQYPYLPLGINQKRPDSPNWPTDSLIPKYLPNMDCFSTRSVLYKLKQNQSNFLEPEKGMSFTLQQGFST